MKKLIIALVLAVLFVKCANQNNETEKLAHNKTENIITLTKEQIYNAGIKTEVVNKSKISSVLKVNGKIDVPPQNLISISVPLGGYLKSTEMLNGMPVKKGQILAVLQDYQYIKIQEDYLTAKAQFSVIESEYFRQKELNQSKAVSDKSFEIARANYQTQLVLIKSLEEKLKLLYINPSTLSYENISSEIKIYSPITGYVSKINVNVGKYLSAGEVIFELINPSDIHLTLTVFEKDIEKLYIGQQLIAYNNFNPNKKYACEIILIANDIKDNNSIEVHCHFKEYDKNLIPGMFMNAEIETKVNTALVLPEDALVRLEGKLYAFAALENNQFKMLEIEPGITENGYTEILNTNINDQQFVTKGAYYLLMMVKNNNNE